jgi:hypothetical protein
VVQRPGEKFRENADQIKSHGFECNEVEGVLSWVWQAHEPPRNGLAVSLVLFAE